MAQIGLLGVPGLTLADANQFSYGPKGEMAPESALKEQALNRRRQIANLLLQRGMAGAPAGQMVGRFYVPSSPLQHVAGLGQVLAGVASNKFLDDDQKKVADDDRSMVTQAILDHQNRMKQLQDVQQAPVGTGAPPQPEAPPPVPPRPDGPYQGEVGAIPAPEAGVQSDKPPIPAQPPASIAGQPSVQGVPMDNVQPGDMSQFAPAPSPAPPQAPPAMPPAQPPAPRRETMDDLVSLLTHQHPAVRRFGEMKAAMLQKQNDLENQREFMSSEKAMDRDIRREGILENSRMREAQMQNTMALTQMQIEARMQQGKDANDLKESLAKQANDLQKLQIQTSAELKKAEIGARSDMAKQHDETLKAIAQAKQQAKGQLPTSALKMQNEELDAIGTASSIKSDMASIRNQIESGKLKLGPMSNLAGQAKNYLGMSDENSRNLASFKASLEKMRNESLRLNKGVQTEGDAVRAWNELMDNMNDPKLVQQRLGEIEAMNDRAVNLRRMNVDTIRQNFGVAPLDTEGYEKQPATVGSQKGSAPSGNSTRSLDELLKKYGQ